MPGPCALQLLLWRGLTLSSRARAQNVPVSTGNRFDWRGGYWRLEMRVGLALGCGNTFGVESGPESWGNGVPPLSDLTHFTHEASGFSADMSGQKEKGCGLSLWRSTVLSG